ncbi:MAG: PspC domain-containing protein [Coprococcus sp.]
MMNKIKLRKSKSNKMLTGVCGGLGETFDIDATLIRLVWAVLSIFSVGTGLLLYIAAAIIIPEDDDIVDAE